MSTEKVLQSVVSVCSSICVFVCLFSFYRLVRQTFDIDFFACAWAIHLLGMNVAVLVLCTLWPFYFVAVLICSRFGCTPSYMTIYLAGNSGSMSVESILPETPILGR